MKEWDKIAAVLSIFVSGYLEFSGSVHELVIYIVLFIINELHVCQKRVGDQFHNVFGYTKLLLHASCLLSCKIDKVHHIGILYSSIFVLSFAINLSSGGSFCSK